MHNFLSVMSDDEVRDANFGSAPNSPVVEDTALDGPETEDQFPNGPVAEPEGDIELIPAQPMQDEVDEREREERKKKERITTPYMTKYERARILGTRALQISMNAPIMVDLEGETDPLEIAMKELRHRRIPLVIRRKLPDGSYEDWSVDELMID